MVIEPSLWSDPKGAKGNQVAEYRFRPSEHGLRAGDVVRITAHAVDNRSVPEDPSIEANEAVTDAIELRIIESAPVPESPDCNDGLSEPDQQPATNDGGNEKSQSDTQSEEGGKGKQQSGSGDSGEGTSSQQEGDPNGGGSGSSSDKNERTASRLRRRTNKRAKVSKTQNRILAEKTNQTRTPTRTEIQMEIQTRIPTQAVTKVPIKIPIRTQTKIRTPAAQNQKRRPKPDTTRSFGSKRRSSGSAKSGRKPGQPSDPTQGQPDNQGQDSQNPSSESNSPDQSEGGDPRNGQRPEHDGEAMERMLDHIRDKQEEQSPENSGDEQRPDSNSQETKDQNQTPTVQVQTKNNLTENNPIKAPPTTVNPAPTRRETTKVKHRSRTILRHSPAKDLIQNPMPNQKTDQNLTTLAIKKTNAAPITKTKTNQRMPMEPVIQRIAAARILEPAIPKICGERFRYRE